MPPLLTLILAGGASRRMQTDKAALPYDGRPQLERVYELARTVCDSVYVSVRADQVDDPFRSKFLQIVDRLTNRGPIAGIAAAQDAHPDAAWLVLACDLPFLTGKALAHLIHNRDATRMATAYRSSHDGLPEPLCAIWEPASHGAIEQWIAAGKECPRKLLLNSDVHLLEPYDAHVLDNVNTREEYGAATAALSQATGYRLQATGSDDAVLGPAVARSPSPVARYKTLHIQYFALLREQAGRREEAVTSRAATADELYTELKSRYPFTLRTEQLKVAVNSEFRDWRTPLNDGDTVVFIPPVAGG